MYSDEDFVVENTHISDEAVIAYMIIDNSISLSNSNVLILGYGHCGRDLAAKLEKFNAKVSISNRSDNCKIYDVASTPYGLKTCDRDESYHLLKQLPTKYAYDSSAKALYKAIKRAVDQYA